MPTCHSCQWDSLHRKILFTSWQWSSYFILLFWDSQQVLLRSRYRPDANIKSSIPTLTLKTSSYTYSEHMASWRAFIRPLPSQAGAISWSLGEVIIANTGDPDTLYFTTAGMLYFGHGVLLGNPHGSCQQSFSQHCGYTFLLCPFTLRI